MTHSIDPYGPQMSHGSNFLKQLPQTGRHSRALLQVILDIVETSGMGCKPSTTWKCPLKALKSALWNARIQSSTEDEIGHDGKVWEPLTLDSLWLK